MAALLVSAAVHAGAPAGRKFEWTTKSDEARKLLRELQLRIENFQLGPENAEEAKKIVAADPAFAMGQYYLSAVTPSPQNEKEYEKARALAKDYPGERLIQVILGQLYAGDNQADKARIAFEKTQAIGPKRKLSSL